MAHGKESKVVFGSFGELSSALQSRQQGERKQEDAIPLTPTPARFSFRQAVMPERSPIDKVAALVLIERRQTSPIEDIAFWGNPRCSSRQLDLWRQNNILPIDLGEEKYNRHLDRVGSATEFLAVRLGLTLSVGERRLIDLINENNRSGRLKQAYMSVAWLMRELYELEDDHAEVVSRADHVVEMFLQEGECGESGRTGKEIQNTFPSYLNEVRRCNFAPFTIGRYLRDMWRIGLDPDAIRQNVEWWVERWHKVLAALDDAREEVRRRQWKEYIVGDALRLRTLDLEGKNLDKFLVKKASKTCDVLLVTRNSGHAAILAQGFDVRGLGDELMRLEPECWFTAEIQGFVLNGGRMYTQAPPTGLSREALIKVIREFPPVR